MATNTSSFSFRAGALAGLEWGAFGGIAAFAFIVAEGAVRRWQLDMDIGEFGESLSRSLETFIEPALGSAVMLGCAGWAAHAPRPAHRIGPTLLIIAVASVLAWCFIGAAEVLPRRYKGMEHPIIYLSEFFAIIAPPVLAAALLTAERCKPNSTKLPSH